MIYAVVACGARKRAVDRCEARDLYCSPWFKKARRYAERVSGGHWWILSAKHGLVEPDNILEPYDESLIGKRKDQRQDWATWIFNLIRWTNEVQPGDTIIVLAGDTYTEFLVPELKRAGIHVQTPLRGLGIGEQLHWFTAHDKQKEETHVNDSVCGLQSGNAQGPTGAADGSHDDRRAVQAVLSRQIRLPEL